MFIEILKSKIHRAFVTEVNINYQGSITIDEDLMDAANIVEHEKVQVLNYNNGERIDTYVIKGKRGTGEVCMNGPAARKFLVGDPIIVISYAMIDAQEAKNLIPKIIFVDNNNKMITK
ncbi:MAG TPA: aspartate 1-decarboxylase [Bacteroidales bacterium]|jgi:aspartate 1-decarboxylase|nr:aspartate 1-decarboxylase [Bacteroidales bacterium]OQC45687.1 MAG: Aspartate 1-decarboxylase precursor [Bacteroidetes bacterium ADurb.Bin035]MBP8947047.1 aspartate 1-decarboxylase [Bacteroidales bacterium]HCM29380.1 aspartate 1-decarboxylase [Bacteroidales bacterium]HNT71177.1 aspartate 1-decarboxylase [Bacteroidales bacterium]